MALLVDANNVLHVTGVLPPDLAGIDLDGLIHLVERSRFARRPVCLVCDGPGRAAGEEQSDRSTIRVVHAGRGRSADDAILALIDRSSAPRHLTVVTLDRRLADDSRRRGCRILRSDAFLGALAHDHAHHARRDRRRLIRPAGPLPPGEVEYWLRVFGVADRDAAPPEPARRPHPERPMRHA
jgi:hypothetical protein